MRSKFRFSVRSKIVLGYIATIVCFVVSLIFVDNQIAVMQQERNYVIEHDMTIHNLTNQIEKRLLDMEIGHRGFTITGDTEYLKPYESGKSGWREDYLQLHDLLADSPSQQSKLADIRTLIERWIEVAGDTAVSLKKENRTEALAQFYKTDPGKSYMDEIRTRFEAFRQTETALTDERAVSLNDRNTALKTVLYVMLSAILFISAVLATTISGSIVRTIREVIRSLGEIADSESSTRRIEATSRDEIGELAKAANALLEHHEQKNWLKTKLAEVVGMYQGARDLHTLGQSLLTKAAPLLGADYAVLYIRSGRGEERRLTRWVSYAAEGEAEGAPGFRIGEGLVGQCAAENRVLELSRVPDGYIRVASGLGHAAPRSVLIAPVDFEGEVVAVLELASLEPFAPLKRELLEELLDTFGLAIISVESRMEIERLLRESQAQTEELQTQAEELQTQAEELQTQQEELRVSNEQLEEQIRHSEQKSRELEQIRLELEEYAEQLKQSSRYKSNFLANMSHELRTPLNSMLILSQLLAENASLTPDEQQYARVIHSAGNDLLNLINDILDLSKVEAGKIDIVAEETNVTELPTVMKYQFDQVAERKGIAFAVRIDPDVPTIFWTDERRLHQILRNLLSNAFKFTESGSVTLTIGVADPNRLSGLLPIKESDSVLAFSVADTGIGIPANKRETIFEAFQQADGTTSRKYGGTGLGLSICREFAKLLGGTIVVDSMEGRGSTFTLYLPSIESSQLMGLIQARAEAAAEAETGGSPLRAYAAGEGAAESFEAEKPRTAAENAAAEKAGAKEPAAKEPVPELLLAGKPEAERLAERADKSVFRGKRVLVVDDDARNLFALRSMMEDAGIHVTVAGNGQQCLELLDKEERFDIVLMDIMMPVLDGYETMRRIRQNPRFETMPIIALTAKAMKYDRVKCIEAGASDYISKPLNMHQLFSLMRVWLAKG